MKVTAKEKGFSGTQIRREGEVFDFNVEVREDGSNNLGSWMEPTPEGKKELDKLTKKALGAAAKKAETESTPDPDAVETK